MDSKPSAAPTQILLKPSRSLAPPNPGFGPRALKPFWAPSSVNRSQPQPRPLLWDAFGPYCQAVPPRALIKSVTRRCEQQHVRALQQSELDDFDATQRVVRVAVDLRDEALDIDNIANDTPVVKFINKVLFDAIKHGASDIHFEPYENEYRVRVRADGVLREIVRPPKGLSPRLAARLKVMARSAVSPRTGGFS